jgi:hypothetical protein
MHDRVLDLHCPARMFERTSPAILATIGAAIDVPSKNS